MNQQNQNQQKIKNPPTEVPKTPQMNERDFLNDLLTTEKYMTTAYSVALHEASHEGFYQVLMNIFSETQDCQRDLYDLMYKNGWYSVEAADQQKLQQSYQQFQGYTNQFPGGGMMQ